MFNSLTTSVSFYMVTHMKTTIDMPDSLFRRTKALALKRRVPMRELITEGLLHVLEKKEAEAPRRIEPVTFKGQGLSPEFSKGTWTTVRDAVYEEHGA